VAIDLGAGSVEKATREHTATTVFAAMRPHQWTKNLLVFAGIIFAARLGDPIRWLEAVACFGAYCAASSSAYLVNDVRDREADRAHPGKRRRPIASGDLGVRTALWLAATLAVLALCFTMPLGLKSIVLLLAFAVAQVSYTLGFKHVVIVDVLLIAILFVLRAAAGAAAVHVVISPWLLLCTGLLSLFLALAKRRGELVLAERNETPGRPVLDGYTVVALDQLITIVAASTIVAYCLYTFSARESSVMMVTIPFVVFGVFRYLLLVQHQDAGEEPDRLLLTDRPIQLCIAAWVLTCALVLVVT
jgi:4-hydroxybenzoate polyprenyltransferase